MLTMIEQPRPVGNPPQGIRQPLTFVIQTDDQVAIAGNPPAFRVRFGSSGATQDSLVTIMGIQFSVDNTQSATPTSWDTSIGAQFVAESFAEMLGMRFEFRNFNIEVVNIGGGVWEVACEGFLNETIDPAKWVFNVSSVAVELDCTIPSSFNGNPPVLKDTALWYRVHTMQGERPMSSEMLARFIFRPNEMLEGSCEVDVSSIVWQAMRIPAPDLLSDEPEFWAQAMQHWQLLYAQVDINADCSQEAGRLYRSDEFRSTIIVRQPEEPDTFDFLFTGGSPRPWMTRRQTGDFVRGFARVCKGVHEFLSFQFVHSTNVTSHFRVTYRVGIFADNDLTLVDSTVITREGAEQGIWCIGVGAANENVKALINANPGVNFLDVTVEMFRNNAPAGYYPAHTFLAIISEECPCHDLEMYFLEDLGSYRTLLLFELEEQVQEQVATVERSAVDWLSGDRAAILLGGGRRTKTVEASDVYRHRTDVRSVKDAALYAELQRSRQVYVKDPERPAFIRSVAIERVDQQVDAGGSGIVITVTWRYNTGKTVRP